LAALTNASFCLSLKLVGIVITAEVTVLPRKSEADEASRLMWRVEISDTVTVDGVSSSLSLIVKAMVES
jgi:hypothetical protein